MLGVGGTNTNGGASSTRQISLDKVDSTAKREDSSVSKNWGFRWRIQDPGEGDGRRHRRDAFVLGRRRDVCARNLFILPFFRKTWAPILEESYFLSPGVFFRFLLLFYLVVFRPSHRFCRIVEDGGDFVAQWNCFGIFRSIHILNILLETASSGYEFIQCGWNATWIVPFL